MKKIVVTLMLAAFAAAPAVAGVFYVGVKTGSAEHSVKTSGYSEGTFALGMFGGYAINRFVAVEGEYADLGSIVSDYSKVTTSSINVVLLVPIESQLSLFAKLGSATTQEEFQGLTSSLSAATFGLGGQFHVNESFNLRVGMDRYDYGGDQGFYKGTAKLYSVSGLFIF